MSRDLVTTFTLQDYDHRLINCKMAFLFTAVSESMRGRVVDYNGVKILADITTKLVYDTVPIVGKIQLGKKRSVKQGCVTLAVEDLTIAAG